MIKHLLIIAAILLTINLGMAQPPKHNPPPLYFIDSVQVKNGSMYFISPKNIKSINVAKTRNFPNGAIYITLKDHDVLKKVLAEKFLSLNEIAAKNISSYSSTTKIIFILNEKLISDTANVCLPESSIKEVAVTKSAETDYAKQLQRTYFLKVTQINGQ